MKKLLPVLLAVLGLAVGGGLGLVLRPAPEPVEDENATAEAKDAASEEPEVALENRAYVKINNQFVVPLVQNNAVTSLVVLSISLETTEAETEALYSHEPKLRDAFIRILFDYALSGGFGADFTSSPNLDRLRTALREAAQNVVPGKVLDVLITDIVRQDT